MEFTSITDILLDLLISVVIGFIIRLINLKISDDKLKEILKWISIAVRAAENEVQKPKAGKEKKEIVTKFIQNKFNNKIQDEELSIAIEYAVYDMNLEKESISVEKGTGEEIVPILENSTTNQ